MTRVKTFAKTGLAMLASLAAPAVAMANNVVTLAAPDQYADVTTWTISRLAAALINLILVGAGLVAFFFFLYGGLQWILAGGDKEGTEKARKRITSSLIGLVIIFSTFAFINLIAQLLGVSLTNFVITNV